MTETLDALKAHSGDAGLMEGKTIIDVGANVGTTTIPALKTFGMGSSIAFEPAPANVRLLRQNVEANRLEERVAAFEVALSDHDGDVAFDLSDSNSGDHRVRVDDVVEDSGRVRRSGARGGDGPRPPLRLGGRERRG